VDLAALRIEQRDDPTVVTQGYAAGRSHHQDGAGGQRAGGDRARSRSTVRDPPFGEIDGAGEALSSVMDSALGAEPSGLTRTPVCALSASGLVEALAHALVRSVDASRSPPRERNAVTVRNLAPAQPQRSPASPTESSDQQG
jgi:hypothetical protein